MWMSIFRKTAFSLLLTLLLVSIVSAAPAKDSALVGGGKQQADNSLEREIKGGIKVQFIGIERSQRWSSYITAGYSVTSEIDQVIKVTRDGCTLFDSRGNQIDPSERPRIGGHDTDTREIIGGVPTPVYIYYNVGDKYQIGESYPRLTFIINGENLVFRNVPSKP